MARKTFIMMFYFVLLMVFDIDAELLVSIVDLYGVHKTYTILKFVIIRPGLTEMGMWIG